MTYAAELYGSYFAPGTRVCLREDETVTGVITDPHRPGMMPVPRKHLAEFLSRSQDPGWRLVEWDDGPNRWDASRSCWTRLQSLAARS